MAASLEPDPSQSVEALQDIKGNRGGKSLLAKNLIETQTNEKRGAFLLFNGEKEEQMNSFKCKITPGDGTKPILFY